LLQRTPIAARAILSVLLAAAFVALVHRSSDGAVLASRAATLSCFLVGLLAVAGLARAGWWIEPSARRVERVDRVTLGIAVLGALLVASTYAGGEHGIGGDYRMHRMYVYQLLNGYAVAHEPYTGVPGHYTFLPHTLVAIATRVFGITVHWALFAVSAAVSAAIAFAAARLARTAGLEQTAARFFAGLLVLYGGVWAVELRPFQLYLPSIQLAMPFLARNLALLLVLLAADLALSAGSARRAWIGSGIAVGLLGLTRPWEFGLGLGLLAAAAVRERSRDAGWALALGGGISSVYWLPLVVTWVERGIYATREVERAGQLPIQPGLYAPLLPLLALAVAGRREMPGAIRSAAFGLAGLVVLCGAVGASGLDAALGLSAGLLKFERFAPVIALCVFALAAFGLEQLAARAGLRLAAAAGALWLVLGAATTLRATGLFLDAAPLFPSPRWSAVPRHVFDMAGSPLYLRHLLQDPRGVVMVPPAYGHVTASRNGVEVVYSHRVAPIWRAQPFGPFSPAERELAARRFYAGLASGGFEEAILERYGVTHFVSSARGPERLPQVERIGEVPDLDGGQWQVFRRNTTRR
jgi:hypothetical protein